MLRRKLLEYSYLLDRAYEHGKAALLVDFEVSEGIYSRACIEDTDSVCLWLGANVMLEYSCEEATDLLQKNLENARASLEVLVTDLQFLRDQVTITQVLQAQVDMDQTQQLSKLLNKIVLSYSLLLKLNSLH
ncbi:hypothetical protein CsSME_00028140 [Camellia sinensis var. sinensis]